MPDENKFQALTDAHFVVRRTCLRCAHFMRFQTGAEWGTCGLITYEHLKHTGPPRNASVPVDGSCPEHKFRESAKAELGAHQRFIE
jgi:hypothetical protein